MKEQGYIILSCPEFVCPFGWDEFGAGLAVGVVVTALVFIVVDVWRNRP